MVPTQPVIRSVAPLFASSTYISNWIYTNFINRVTGSIFVDQSGVIYIEQTADRAYPADISTSYDIGANNGEGFDEKILCPWIRIRFVNTSNTSQTVLRIFAFLR